MKKMCDHLFTLSVVCVLTLSVVLAQDQAPDALPLPGPGAVSAQPSRPMGTSPAQRANPNPVRKMALPSPVGQPMGAGQTKAVTTASAGSDSTAAPGAEPKSKTTTPSLKFDNATVDIILMAYAQETGKTLLSAPDVPKANITLKSQPDMQLTKEEYLEAIEVVLGMNGIVLEPFGEKFVKVLPRKTIRTEGIKILMDKPETGHPEKSRVISQMIQLKAITIAEAQKALEGFKKADGLIQSFERTNSLLVTDTQENINRMLEIVKFIDQPLVATEEVNVRSIRFAKADDIKKRLEELVAESQKQTQSKEEVKANVSGSPGFTRTTSSALSRALPPGLTRLGTPQPAVSTPNESIETLVSDADRGMIRGKVQIIADERSNQLIIITRADNMAFFDKIITVLDVETAPDVKVEVQRLEFADAEEVSTMLNDLIGNATAKKDDNKTAKGTDKNAADKPGTPAKSTSLAEAVAARATRTETPASGGETGKSKLGQLSKDNIKILADKRTNAIVMMGSPSDLLAIKEIIKGMDIKLSQVLIETVVIQVGLDDSLQTGVDWILGKQNNNYRVNNGDLLGGGGGSTTLGSLINTTNGALDTAASMISPGVNYFLKSEKLNISAMIEAAESDSHAKVLSSPILMTVDNKEATLESTSMRYLYKGVRYSGNNTLGVGTEVPDYEQRDIGLTVKITPRINPNGAVILTIDETFETIGTAQKVGDEEYPTINTRKVQADISVENMQTVVLGGLVQSEQTDSTSGIPLLKDIPVIGKYLFSTTSHSATRSELVVFITPYVMDTPEDMEAEALRRKDVLHDPRPWDDAGWSKSRVADSLSKKEMLEKEKRRWEASDDDYDAKKALDKAKLKREKTLEERAKKDAEDQSRKIKEKSEEAAQKAVADGKDPAEAQLHVLLTQLQEKQRAERAAEQPKAGVHAQAGTSPVLSSMTVTETVNVVGVQPGAAAKGPADGDKKAGAGPSAAAEPQKKWWKFF